MCSSAQNPTNNDAEPLIFSWQVLEFFSRLFIHFFFQIFPQKNGRMDIKTLQKSRLFLGRGGVRGLPRKRSRVSEWRNLSSQTQSTCYGTKSPRWRYPQSMLTQPDVDVSHEYFTWTTTDRWCVDLEYHPVWGVGIIRNPGWRKKGWKFLRINKCKMLAPQWYCWCLKSQTTTWDVWNPINNGINYLSTGARFQPSTVAPSIQQ